MTTNGRKEAKDIVVGDVLIAMELPSEQNADWLNWTAEDLILNETNLRETTVHFVSSKQVDRVYLLNGDAYSETHYILTKKDNVSKFLRIDSIDDTYMVYSYEELGFVNIDSLDVVNYEETVYSINCEPYDNFFTENMLVYDTRDQSLK